MLPVRCPNCRRSPKGALDVETRGTSPGQLMSSFAVGGFHKLLGVAWRLGITKGVLVRKILSRWGGGRTWQLEKVAKTTRGKLTNRCVFVHQCCFR